MNRMTKRALIIGYGRAGKRHAKLCDEFGIDWHFTDIVPSSSPRYKSVANLAAYDFAIIATPPDNHLEAIKNCLDAGTFVLCEKPLCAGGQMAEAEKLLTHPNVKKLAVAYNYRYHPAIVKAKEAGWIYPDRPILMFSSQYRPEMPAWGQVLDHLSHALDTLRFLVQGEGVIIISSRYGSVRSGESAEVHAYARGDHNIFRAEIIDEVSYVSTTPRDVFLLGPWGMIYLNDMNDIDTMYHQMFDDFLSLVNGHPSQAVKLADALETQRLIQEVLDCD